MKKDVRVILDKDGYMIRAGDPLNTDKQIQKEILEAVAEGGTVKTIPYEDYQKLKWIYDKK